MVSWTFSTYDNLCLYILFSIRASFFISQRNSDQIVGNPLDKNQRNQKRKCGVRNGSVLKQRMHKRSVPSKTSACFGTGLQNLMGQFQEQGSRIFHKSVVHFLSSPLLDETK